MAMIIKSAVVNVGPVIEKKQDKTLHNTNHRWHTATWGLMRRELPDV